MQIFGVILVFLHLNRYAFDDLQSITFQPFDLPRIIGHQADLADAQILEDLRPDSIIAQVRRESELQVGIDRIKALFLQLIRLQLVD
ncbi:hypothetical protein D3C76_1701450 [compost metagenome]